MNSHFVDEPYYYNYVKRTAPSMMNFTHFHSKHELYYLEKGETVYFVGDKIYPLHAGDLIFVPGGMFHKTDNSVTNYVERHLFFYDEAFIDSDFMPYIEELKKDIYIQIPLNRQHLILDITRRLSYEVEHDHPDSLKMQKLFLQELLCIVCRLRITDRTLRSSALQQTIQNIMTYISTNVNADLSLPALSDKYSISPSHLSKQFKNVTGMGLNEYINIARVTAAEKLLHDTDLPITEVALKCGFNDSNYFARVFKRLRDITPKKYSMRSRSSQTSAGRLP